MKEELNFSKNNIEKLEKEQIALVKDMSDKPLDKYEMTLQEFIITGFNRTKLESMIYGVSRSKGEGLDYSKKYFNLRSETLSKQTKPSSSSSTQKELYSHFATADKKVLNQSKPITVESEVLKKSEPVTSRSKVLKKSELMCLKSKT